MPQPLGPTTPVRPGLDLEIGLVAKGFETGQMKPVEFHGPKPPFDREDANERALGRIAGRVYSHNT